MNDSQKIEFVGTVTNLLLWPHSVTTEIELSMNIKEFMNAIPAQFLGRKFKITMEEVKE